MNPLDPRIETARRNAKTELAEMAHDGAEKTPRKLLRQALLLHLIDNPDNTLEKIEELLKEALTLDDQYVEAYIEMGRLYYVGHDDAKQARDYFLKAHQLLVNLNQEVLSGLVDCDEELSPEANLDELRHGYQKSLLGQ
jgi:hypothetical protein